MPRLRCRHTAPHRRAGFRACRHCRAAAGGDRAAARGAPDVPALY